MAITNVVVPQLSESVSEATLLTWKKQPGQAVEADEILIEVETDKVVLEVPAPASGVLSEIVKANGSMVTSGEVLARIDTEGKAAAAPAAAPTAAVAAPVAAAAAPAPAAASGAIASPAASKILADKGVSAASVAGSGRDGRITKGDALNASTASAAPAAKAAPLANPSVPMTQSLDGRPEQRVPMSRLRARVAERLLQSQQDNAILTTFNEVNMQAVIDLRNLYKDKFEKEHGVKLGFMSFFVKAAVAALKRYPLLNASVDGKDIIYHGYFDIGIAVGSPRGLVVPILRNADQLSIADIEKTIADFGKRAGEGKLGIEEMTGGTFSISNGGVFGSMLSTPIINPPQSAILGVHATKERAVVEKGQIVIRPINYLAMSYDHRIIDGREAVLGLVAMKEALEDPQRLLLEI
jgi:2-oxoglutarate dehydrogenase E2 component (dihydrolipoamide succinyltransferase)